VLALEVLGVQTRARLVVVGVGFAWKELGCRGAQRVRLRGDVVAGRADDGRSR